MRSRATDTANWNLVGGSCKTQKKREALHYARFTF